LIPMVGAGPRYLVTGASGFVGRFVVDELLADGAEVAASTRRPAEAFPDGVHVVPVVEAGRGIDWSTAVQGAQTVLHLAGRVHMMNDGAADPDPIAEFRRVNVEGTRMLAEQAAAAGVRRFVLVSSAKAVGGGRPDPYTESTPCVPLDSYSVSKLEAEHVVREVGESAGMETVILRPPVVYGPRVRANILRLMTMIGAGWPIPRVGNVRSFIFVRNLSDAIKVCASHPRAANETFFVADDEAVSSSEFACHVGRHLGTTVRLLPAPAPAIRLASCIVGRRSEAARFLESFVVDTSRIRDDLGWVPPYSMADGIAEMTTWFEMAYPRGTRASRARGRMP